MLLALGLTYLSCLAFAISLKRHFHQLFSSHRLFRKHTFIFKSLGWILLALSINASVQLYGFATGLVVLCGLFSAAAFLIALLLPYSPRTIIGIGSSSLVLIFIWFI